MARDFHKRKINLLDERLDNQVEAKPITVTERPAKPTKKKVGRKRKKSSCFFITLIIIFTLIAGIISADNDSFLAGVKNSYLVRQIANIISPGEKYLGGEKDDRINFVFLGMGGPGHDGPYLTDTIIIASFKPSTKKAALFSLPRDMIVPLNPGDYRKINSVYHIGEQENEAGGELVKEVIGNTLDMPIHYYAALDFKGFVEIIDAIGGIEVNVDRSFTDNQFPTEDYEYQVVSFEAGEQEMDGLTSLRFARSRHGNNGEGSDFARIKRQQKIIIAAKDKMTSFNTLINPRKITSLFSLFNKYTKTDLEPWEAVKLVHMAKGLNTQEIIAQSIDDRPGGYLKAGYTLDGAFILQPITGNYEDLKMLIHNIFAVEAIASENAKIVIQNGTASPGLALKAVNHLNQVGYNVIRYGNASDQEKVTTVIYNYMDNKPKTKDSLEAIFQTKAKTDIPLEFSNSVITSDWDIRNEEGELEQLDFLIILGSDQEIDDSAAIITTIDPSLFASTTTSTTNLIIE